MFQKMTKKDKVFTFLVGLNNELDKVRHEILSREIMPSTHKVFLEV